MKLFDYNDVAEMLMDNKQRMESGEIGIRGLYEDGEIIGELRAKFRSEDGGPFAVQGKRAYLYAFRISEAHQGKGSGLKLLNSVLQELTANGYSEFTVGVGDDNVRARHLYNKSGFVKTIGRKRETYQDDIYEFDLLLRD